MREIKFRVWDKKLKNMHQNEGFHDCRIAVDMRGLLFYHDDTSFQMRNFAENNFILMQYTGLQDKNGKEIYFSDLCLYKDDSGKEQTGVVKDYGYLKGYIEAIGGDDEGNQDIELHPDYEIEIIGNIYES